MIMRRFFLVLNPLGTMRLLRELVGVATLGDRGGSSLSSISGGGGRITLGRGAILSLSRSLSLSLALLGVARNQVSDERKDKKYQ